MNEIITNLKRKTKNMEVVAAGVYNCFDNVTLFPYQFNKMVS